MTGYCNESIQRLLQAICTIESYDECRAFFEDICTIKELQDMAQRLDTAIALDQGKNYQEITAQVGVSTATISRVSRCLNYGSGGYRAIIQKINEDTK